MAQIMYLPLPGFPKVPPDQNEEDQQNGNNLGASTRIKLLSSRYAKQSRTRPRLYKFTSNDLDDRISWIEYEINVGKRLPEVRQIAAAALKTSPSRDWKREATALFEWTRKNVRYTLDPDKVELFQSAQRSAEVGIGDCDDQAIMLSSLLQAVGIPVRLRVIGMKGSRQFQHIYVVAGLPPDKPSEWFPLDPSREFNAGWELPESERGLIRDYDVTDFNPDD